MVIDSREAVLLKQPRVSRYFPRIVRVFTKFKSGYSTKDFGARCHTYPEEIFVVSGRLYDETFGMWLEPGYYASRPPGEVHGPFIADGEVVILEMSYPSQDITKSCSK